MLTGDADFLSSLQGDGRIEVGADRLRRLYRETGDWQVLIEEMKQRWAQELEEVKAKLETLRKLMGRSGVTASPQSSPVTDAGANGTLTTPTPARASEAPISRRNPRRLRAPSLPTRTLTVPDDAPREKPGKPHKDDQTEYRVVHVRKGEYPDVKAGRYLVDANGKAAYKTDVPISQESKVMDNGDPAPKEFTAATLTK